MKVPLLAVFLLTHLPCHQLLAYAEAGHRVVGAVADKLLEGKPAGEAMKKLLGSVTLERASTLADELRGEDKSPGNFKLPENPQLEAEMLAFRAANPPTEDLSVASHHWFHYTDVPIQLSTYASTKAGVSKWDIVHMIPYCYRVLHGDEKPDNDRKITPAVALVLLSHYVGDLHQPLHVGAIFLNKNGDMLDPNTHPDALETRGGNDLNFGGGSLHSFWDADAVESSLTFQRRIQGKRLDELLPKDWAQQLAAKEPSNWKPDPSWKPEIWAEKWADEILPIAREAHERLRILPQEEFDKGRGGKPVLRWTAIEKPHPGKDYYGVWASKIVSMELPKAGWRLAALVETALNGK